MDCSCNSVTNAILIGISSILILTYLWLKRRYSYWERKGIPHEKATSIIFGNLKEVFYDKTKHMVMIQDEIYKKFSNEPYCGYYEFHYPILMIRDPQMVQAILVEKFSSFQLPKITINDGADEFLNQNPFCIRGSRWKDVKGMLSMGLTQNRVRILEDIIKNVSQDMYKFIDNNPGEFEAYHFASSVQSEIIANFGWGVKSDGFSQDSTMKKMFDLIQFSSGNAFNLMLLHPLLSRLLNLRFFTKQFTSFLKDVTKQAADSKETNKSTQYTFLQHLLNTREKLKTNGKDMSMDEISAHMSTFFLDGYETISRVLTLNLHTLASYPDIQQKVKEEIKSIGDEITLEATNKLQYMEMFMLEVFRYHRLFPFLGRICNETCKIGNLEIEKGQLVSVPFTSIHYDSNYYPNPEVFNPENFSEENKSKRHKATFFSFGAGPRMCLGMRFANASIKLILCYILRNYDVILPKDRPVQYFEPNSESPLVFIPKDTMYIAFKKTN